MLRTWSVRLEAMKLTESVRSRHVPDTPATSAWPPSFPSVPTSLATRVTSAANERSWSTIVLSVHGVLLAQVAGRHGGGHLGDVADLVGQVGRHEVHGVGQVLPRARRSRDLGLSTELSFRSHFPRDSGHLGGEARELIDHRV